MKIEHTFHIRRYWFRTDTPQEVLDTLNIRWGISGDHSDRVPYVDVPYVGQTDRILTIMELKYAEHIDFRQEVGYKLEGDDGLGN